MLDRVTSSFEIAGIVLLTAAVAIATGHRYGLVWAFVAAGVLCFAWSLLFELISGRMRRPARPAVQPEQVYTSADVIR